MLKKRDERERERTGEWARERETDKDTGREMRVGESLREREFNRNGELGD